MEQSLVYEQIEDKACESDTFVLKDESEIPSLGLRYEAWEHQATGAMHIHLDSGESENVFLVGLRTVPTDDTGVAHILEHTALCGSKKYPVRDPFFMMIRRSINTFMNAFTSSDWTAYPFASANHKDFENLLSVYLDAVFSSRLDPMDFNQEGHRFSFSESGNIDSSLCYQGVVYNEMKGAMSSPTSLLWQALTKHLFPKTTYHFNSGGEPEAIPDLSHEDLVAFYKKHYHPSNAIFMTYGDLPASWYHERIESQVCAHFSKSDDLISVPQEPQWTEPKAVEVAYPSQETQGKTYHVMAWLLSDVTDYETTLTLMFLAKVLLDHSGSPLTQVLETSEFGQGTSPIEGLLDDARMLGFACGIEGSERQHASQVHDLILSSLQSMCQAGVPIDEARAALRQFELEQREVTGGRMPYGLELILRTLPGAVHRGDPKDFLAIDDRLKALAEKIEDPSFIPGLIQTYLLGNPHQILLTCYPDDTLAEKNKKEEDQKLKAIQKRLSHEEKTAIVELNQKLDERQKQEEDLSILPEVLLEDISRAWSLAQGHKMIENSVEVDAYAQPTNGLVYQSSVTKINHIDHAIALAEYDICAAELGCGDNDYLAQQSNIYANTGGLHTRISVVSHLEDADQVKLYWTYSGKGLVQQAESLASLITEMKQSTRLDEPSRIEDLMRQDYASSVRGITGRGHEYAMMAAVASFSAPAALKEDMYGLAAIKRLGEKLTDFDASYKQWCHDWQQAQEVIQSGAQSHCVVSTQEYLPESVSAMVQKSTVSEDDPWVWHSAETQIQGDRAYIVDTQVNFCAKAYPSVGYGHTDHIPLSLLGIILRNGFCHRAIREQGGAYGGGAAQKSLDHAFVFYSYRDPRLEATFADFDAAVDWVCSTAITESMLKEAKLGMLAQIDKPLSPASRAKAAFYSTLEGRSESLQQEKRAEIFDVTAEQVLDVANRYLRNKTGVRVVITGENQTKLAESLGMQLVRL